MLLHRFPTAHFRKNHMHKLQQLTHNHTLQLSQDFQLLSTLHHNLNTLLLNNILSSHSPRQDISSLHPLSQVPHLASQAHLQVRSTHTNHLLPIVHHRLAHSLLVLYLYHLHLAYHRDHRLVRLQFQLTKCNSCIKVNKWPQINILGRVLLNLTKGRGQAIMGGMVREIKTQLCHQPILLLKV